MLDEVRGGGLGGAVGEVRAGVAEVACDGSGDEDLGFAAGCVGALVAGVEEFEEGECGEGDGRGVCGEGCGPVLRVELESCLGVVCY